MKSTFEFSPLAATDLDEIWDYISFENNVAARRLMEEFLQKFHLIAQNPLIGSARNELILNIRQFPHKRYNIFYFQTDTGIEIYRVLHSSRNTIQIFGDTID